ncbi:MAG: lipopolysaccharide biosynthesis protein [Verrucomicrobiales bacterium]|jgi:O-antigen/teichoic acid export membrane protein|nr:lipopolysaccharide biosynthesis protein [Verrucomicrobiales bacterium]
MSRSKRYVIALGSGYLQLLVNILYTLLSVSLALRYLSPEQFGLWVVILQISTFLTLLDAGMDGAFSRYLIDYKDNRSGGIYGGVVKVACKIFYLQGVLVLLVGLLASFLCLYFFKVPSQYASVFQWLLLGQCSVCAFSFFVKICSSLLQVHQRNDWINCAGIVQLAVSIGLMWIFLKMQWGLCALLASNFIATLLATMICFYGCLKHGFFPKKDESRTVAPKLIKEIVKYGLDFLLANIGQQLLTICPTLIVARVMGWEAVAVWGIMNKPFAALFLFIWKIGNYSYPILSEMHARKEDSRLQKRFFDVTRLGNCLAVIAAIGIIFCNDLFVRVWTHGQIQWTRLDGVVLGVYFLSYSVGRNFNFLPAIIKQVGALKYVYLGEAIIFIVSSMILIKANGFWIIICCLIFGSISCSGSYAIYKTMKYFDLNAKEIIKINAPWIKMFLLLCSVVYGISLLPGAPREDLVKLIVLITVTMVSGAVFYWQYALDRNAQGDIKNFTVKLLRRLSGV